MKNYYVASPSLPIGADTPEAQKLVADYRKAYPKDSLDNGVVAGWTAAYAFGEALKKACQSKDLTRAGVDGPSSRSTPWTRASASPKTSPTRPPPPPSRASSSSRTRA